MNRFERNKLYYWNSIPIGVNNAASYDDLCELWELSHREARRVLHDLATEDDGSDLVLIRSSKGGFYRTENRAIIASYRKEIYNKGRSLFAQLAKCNRVLRDDFAQYKITNNVRMLRLSRNLSQCKLASLVQDAGLPVTQSTISAIENDLISPSPKLSSVLAEIFGVPVEDVVKVC